VIFRSITRVTASDAPVVYEAIRHGLAVYVAHTNLDAAPGGTNDVLADVLQIGRRRPLEPIIGQGQCKVVVFLPPDDLSAVAGAAFAAGAGRMGNYQDCGFFCHGLGSFCGDEGTHPAVGEAGRQEVTEELRLEVICPRAKVPTVREAIRSAHSYEEPAIDTYALESFPEGCGWGRIGKLKRPVTLQTVINRLKRATGARKVLLAGPGEEGGDGMGMLVTTAACFSGSGGSFYREAIAQGAGLYVTGEMGHHDAIDAVAGGMAVVCLGHGHSERIAMARLGERLASQLPKLSVLVSERDRDPYTIV
jgi:putative NIF3 family GTP cyclohydrolase 1 type 2